jgi:hypothetical protein
MVTGLQAGQLGFSSWQRRDFSLSYHVQTGTGVHPASYPVDTRGSFPNGVEWMGLKLTTLHLVPRLRLSRAITSTVLYIIMVWCVTSTRDIFTVTFVKKLSDILFIWLMPFANGFIGGLQHRLHYNRSIISFVVNKHKG